jgi:ribosomal protein S18 acetylase RimI-like enzyme
MSDALLATLEGYYDTAPRASTDPEEVGPFTLFVQRDPEGWPFYARPRLGLSGDITVDDVAAVLARQAELGLTASIEWVHETTPSLLAAARAAGLDVEECPLLVLAEGSQHHPLSRRVGEDLTPRTAVLPPDDPDLPVVVGAVHAGFSSTDDVEPRDVAREQDLIERGLLVMVGAYDAQGRVVGGGSHGPRGGTTELVGIAVLPGARRRGVGGAITAALVADARARGIDTVFLSARDDAVARVYERIGFVRVGTACIAAKASA